MTYTLDMKLIIGLGNPESEYSWTRHNIGKEIVNQIALKLNIGFKVEKLCDAELAKEPEYVLAKPLVHMNESGVAVSKLIKFFGVEISNVVVIYDELDLVVGQYKFAYGKSSKIHNGVDSIRQYLKSDDYWHMRVGVREKSILGSVQKTGRDPAKYVLNRFPSEDKKIVQETIESQILPELNLWLSKK